LLLLLLCCVVLLQAQGRKSYMEDRHALACLHPSSSGSYQPSSDFSAGVGVNSHLAYAGEAFMVNL
jgi:hypothetical protein